MKPTTTLCGSLSAMTLALMAGCAGEQPLQARGWRMEPVLSVTHSQASAEAYYQMGRYYAGMQRWDRAIDAYGTAVAADPRHVQAQSALAVALAQVRRTEEANAVLRRALALAPKPESAVIDAAATPAAGPTGVASPAAALAMQVVDHPTIAALQLATALMPRAETGAVVQASGSLELSNGGGVPGAAGRMRQWLAVRGIATQRLSNQRPYHQQRTVIQYRPGREAAAQRVAALLPAGTQTLAMEALRTDVRVVLGRDGEPVASCIEQAACKGSTRLAQADTNGR